MHEAGGPFVFVGGVDPGEGFFHIRGVKTNERVLPDLGATDRFGFDLIDAALAALLSRRVLRQDCASQ
jgi:hypothetical protein